MTARAAALELAEIPAWELAFGPASILVAAESARAEIAPEAAAPVVVRELVVMETVAMDQPAALAHSDLQVLQVALGLRAPMDLAGRSDPLAAGPGIQAVLEPAAGWVARADRVRVP
jgi:hypothetical protein